MNKKSHYVSTLTYQMEATMKLCYGFMKNYFEASDRHRISFDEYVVLDTLICYSHLDAKLISKTLYRKETEIKDILLKLEKKKLIRKTQK